MAHDTFIRGAFKIIPPLTEKECKKLTAFCDAAHYNEGLPSVYTPWFPVVQGTHLLAEEVTRCEEFADWLEHHQKQLRELGHELKGKVYWSDDHGDRGKIKIKGGQMVHYAGRTIYVRPDQDDIWPRSLSVTDEATQRRVKLKVGKASYGFAITLLNEAGKGMGRVELELFGGKVRGLVWTPEDVVGQGPSSTTLIHDFSLGSLPTLDELEQ